MKTFTNILLAATAIAVSAGVAHADTLSNLKFDMQTMDAARVNKMVGNAGAFDSSDVVHTIMISPTADAPAAPAAPATVLAWAGYSRLGVYIGRDNTPNTQAGLVNLGNGVNTLDLLARARLTVTGSTETDMGTFGASVRIRTIANGLQNDNEQAGAFNGGRSLAAFDGYYGWWKSGNITFSGGNGSEFGYGGVGYNSIGSFDAVCTCIYGLDGWGSLSGPRNGRPFGNSSSNTPIGAALAYRDSALLFAVGVEDAGNNNAAAGGGAIGVTGKLAYNNDLKAGAFGAEVSGGYWGAPAGGVGGNPAATNGAWNITGAVTAKFDPITFGASLGTGNIGGYGGNRVLPLDQNYTIGNIYAIANLGSGISMELGVVRDFDGSPNGLNANANRGLGENAFAGATLFEGGLYWKPKKQFVLGAEAQYQDGGLNSGGYTAAMVTRWSF